MDSCRGIYVICPEIRNKGGAIDSSSIARDVIRQIRAANNHVGPVVMDISSIYSKQTWHNSDYGKKYGPLEPLVDQVQQYCDEKKLGLEVKVQRSFQVPEELFL